MKGRRDDGVMGKKPVKPLFIPSSLHRLGPLLCASSCLRDFVSKKRCKPAARSLFSDQSPSKNRPILTPSASEMRNRVETEAPLLPSSICDTWLFEIFARLASSFCVNPFSNR